MEEAPKPRPKKKGPWWVLILLLLGIVGTFAAITTPKYAAARYRANTRACYANQKTIAGAIELYNLDHKTTLSDPRTAGAMLVQAGYLNAEMIDPGSSAPAFESYEPTPGGNGIRCSVHGPIQDPEPGGPGSESVPPASPSPGASR